MTKKPNIILLRDIVLPFEQANKELALIKQDIDNSKEQRQIKSLFLYSYAIFESTLVQSYANILYAFPERMNADKIDFVKYKNDIISNSLSHTLIEQLSADFSQNLMYGKISDGLKKYANTLQIPILDKIHLSNLEKIKRLRNTIIHNTPIQTIYNPQIQISAESETKRSIFREKDKTKRSKKESAQHSKSRNKSFVMTSVSAL